MPVASTVEIVNTLKRLMNADLEKEKMRERGDYNYPLFVGDVHADY